MMGGKNIVELMTDAEWRIAGGAEEEEVEGDLEAIEDKEEEKEGVWVEREGLQDAEQEGVEDREVDRVREKEE